MSVRWICRIVCIGLLLGLASAGKTDDGYVAGIGGAVRLMHGHPTIRMVSEEVHIHLPDGKVSAQFVFKNEGPATTVEIGFPETGKGRRSQMVDFQSTVDGQAVRVTLRVATKPTDENDYHYAFWWVKKVSFARGQTRAIINHYKGGLTVNNDGLHVSGFLYVLKTGASWHGSIGRARIVCDLGNIAHCGPISFQPVGGRRAGRTITWDLHNLKPKEDVWIEWYKGFADISINDRLLWKKGDEYGHMKVPAWESPSSDYAVRPLVPFKRGREIWIPVRLAAQWLDAGLEGDPQSGTITLIRNGSRTLFKVGSSTLKTEAGAIALSDSVFERDGTIYIPLQALVKTFGGKAHYNPSGRLLITLP